MAKIANFIQILWVADRSQYFCINDWLFRKYLEIVLKLFSILI